MKKSTITEDQVKEVLDKILNEEVSKVTKYDFSRTQFKIEELQNSLNETLKDFHKLQESLPDGLKNVTKKRMLLISQYLIGVQGNIMKLKDVVKTHKKKLYSQSRNIDSQLQGKKELPTNQ